MRIVGSFQDPRQALAFSQFLRKHEIPHQVELVQNTDWGSTEYGNRLCEIWVHDEDQWPEAMKWYNNFKANPNDPLFEYDPHQGSEPIPPTKSYIDWRKRPLGWVTRGILLICCALFFSNLLFPPPANVPEHMPFILFTSPLEKELLYDYPKAYEIINQLVDKYGFASLSNPNTLPQEGRALVMELAQTPYWEGLYSIVEKKESLSVTPPMFEKIRQGQVWRLFTPALLHEPATYLPEYALADRPRQADRRPSRSLALHLLHHRHRDLLEHSTVSHEWRQLHRLLRGIMRHADIHPSKAAFCSSRALPA